MRRWRRGVANDAEIYCDLKEIPSVVEAGSLTKEVHRISRAVCLTVPLRCRLAATDVAAFLAFALPPSFEAFTPSPRSFPSKHYGVNFAVASTTAIEHDFFAKNNLNMDITP